MTHHSEITVEGKSPTVYIKQIAIPEWLAGIDAQTINAGSFSLIDVLTDSLYYPSSAFDGNPVKYLGGNFSSFIYVDYGFTRQQLFAELATYSFTGYEVLAQRELTSRDLAPHGWVPPPLRREDGDPRQRKSWIMPPFAIWLVFQRKADFTSEHGPERFSMVYLCADGVAAYQALYVGNKVTPKAIAIIQPGISFGGNWTDFRAPDRIFGRTVLQNPAGKPEYLLLGRWESSVDCACWPGYDTLVWQQKSGHQHLRLWKYSSL